MTLPAQFCLSPSMPRQSVFVFICTIMALLLAGCSSSEDGEGRIKKEAKYPTGADRGATDDIYAEPETIWGGGRSMFSFGGDNDKDKRRSGNSGLEINSFLWRASLDTVSFMPLASADPFGGVIITEWYEPPETKGERFKVNAFILGRELRTNALKVKIFRQVKKNGRWEDAKTSPEARQKLEDTILTRARALRVDKLGTLEIRD